MYELDAAGRIVKYGTATYTYNSEGYLVQSYEANGPHNTTITYTWLNGNLTRVNQVGNYGGPQPVVTTVLLDYDDADAVAGIAPSNPLNNFGSSRTVLGAYFGKAAKNLVKKETAKAPNQPDETRTHTYSRDANGNITLVRTVVSDGRIAEKRLAYKCN